MPHGLLNNLRVRISGNQKIPRKFQIPIELLPSAQPPKAENPASTSKNPLKYSYEPPPQYATPHKNQSRPQTPRERPRAPPHRHGHPQTSHSQPQAAPDPPQAAPSGDRRPRATADAPCADGFGWPKIALGAWRWFWVASGGFQ